MHIFYKSTWDLPKRITRSMADELSATPQYKKEAWKLHKKKQENLCKKIQQARKKTRKDIESPTETVAKRDETDETQESRQAQEPEPCESAKSEED